MRKDHRTAARSSRMQELLGELTELHGALTAAYMRFDATTEPELVDACVYEINAAQSRYNYMLRRIKEEGGEAAFGACPGKEDGAAWV